jgi:hypothetical protein
MFLLCPFRTKRNKNASGLDTRLLSTWAGAIATETLMEHKGLAKMVPLFAASTQVVQPVIARYDKSLSFREPIE